MYTRRPFLSLFTCRIRQERCTDQSVFLLTGRRLVCKVQVSRTPHVLSDPTAPTLLAEAPRTSVPHAGRDSGSSLSGAKSIQARNALDRAGGKHAPLRGMDTVPPCTSWSVSGFAKMRGSGSPSSRPGRRPLDRTGASSSRKRWRPSTHALRCGADGPTRDRTPGRPRTRDRRPA